MVVAVVQAAEEPEEEVKALQTLPQVITVKTACCLPIQILE